jgi:hypothetical protein
MIKIKIFTTKGRTGDVIETNVTTWGELKKLVSNAGVSLSNMQATESINKTTFADDAAIIPTQDFALFLRPVKTKAGANYANMSRKEMTDSMSPEQKTALKEATGKNWTNCSTDALRDFLMANSSSKAGAKAVEKSVKPVAKASTSKPTSKIVNTSNNNNLIEELENSITTLDVVSTQFPTLSDLVNNTVGNINSLIQAINSNGVVEKTQKQLDKEEDDAFMAEFSKLK